jgi:molybdopterin-containing oxidoreductase family iron-sulfur binding subunit
MYDTLGAGDVLLALAKEAGRPLDRTGARFAAPDMRQWLCRKWEDLRTRVAPSADPEAFWEESLRAGFVQEPPAGPTNPERVKPSLGAIPNPRNQAAVTRTPTSSPWNFLRQHCEVVGKDLDLWLWPAPMLFDGRGADRPWLQEAPDPVSTIQWGSWIDIHPKTAAPLELSDGDVVEVSAWGGKAQAPLRLTTDVAEGVVAMVLGQGHSTLGRNASGRGVNAFALVDWASTPGTTAKVTVRPTGRKAAITFATATQDQHGREILQWVALSKLRGMKEGEGEHLALPLPEGYDPAKDLAQPRRYEAHRWAMVIDLDRCIGCGACAVACQAENNVAVVGPAEAAKGRTMHWLRVVPYRHPEDPRRVGFLPMLCQHCDCAPCEPVCPVYASVHSEEGLNAQVYNRCIGTRYCSNNCPYKVRRFNWLAHQWPPPLDWQLNPDVSVRCRGVMEKCPFCVQRIRRAKQRARREGRALRDGDVQPACGQSCPTKAILFGDLLDADSQVSRLTRGDPRRYHVLEELNTKPAVTYLRRIEADES